MPKVMLVEDDNNLREIYDARLVAEGYEIVSAHDGEEALALAVKEKPDLIISDIMMPKISGFDMLDILRSTPETKDTKVIMMTALSQAEDRERAGKLGADRYLVKSQVTLEDVIKVAHEVLNDTGQSAPTPASAATPATPPPTQADLPVVSAPPSSDEPATPTPAVVTPPAEPPVAEPVAEELSQPKAQETSGVEQQIQDFISNNPSITTTPTTPPAGTTPPPAEPPVADATSPAPVTSDAPASNGTSIPVTVAPTTPPIEPPTADDIPIPGEMPPAPKAPSGQDALSNPTPVNVGSAADAPSHKKLVLQPSEDATTPAVDLDALLAKEEAKASDATPNVPTSGVVTPAASEDNTPTTVSPNDIAL
ncbi:MAG: hypothetical protein QG553_85 [Patescibacteria group bacterium]|nr:hypothetical protein [Patescibacteria group bacterium]